MVGRMKFVNNADGEEYLRVSGYQEQIILNSVPLATGIEGIRCGPPWEVRRHTLGYNAEIRGGRGKVASNWKGYIAYKCTPCAMMWHKRYT